MLLIIFSIITLTVETLPDLSMETLELLWWTEVGVTIVFTLEYTARAVAATRLREYVLTPSGIIDLLAIAPFYLALGVDLRALRLLRLFRIVRLLRIPQLREAVRRLQLAFIEVKEEALIFLIATVFVIYLSAVGIYYFENESQPEVFASIPHSLWWAVATLTTVGYGDVYPVTIGGRIFTFVILMSGLGVVAVPSGLMATALTQVRGREDSEESNDPD